MRRLAARDLQVIRVDALWPAAWLERTVGQCPQIQMRRCPLPTMRPSSNTSVKGFNRGWARQRDRDGAT